MKPVTDPEVLRRLNTPVTDPKLLARLEGKPAGDDAFDAQIKQDLKDSGGYLENLGAGANRVVQGVKQLFGQGRSDADIEESRKIDEKLAEGRTGGGATQFLGEMLASTPVTMGVGGVLAKGATKVAPKLAQWAAKQGGRSVNLGTTARAATEGAAGGLLNETTEDESGTLNTLIGGAAGAALPAVVAGGRRLHKALSKKNAPNRAAKAFEEQLGPKNMDEIGDALHSPNQPELPLSTAATANNPALASLERGARTRGTNDWAFEHDKKVAEKAWDKLKTATSDADELGARVSDREGMMAASKEALDQAGTPASMAAANKEVSEVAELLRGTSAARQNPELTNLLGQTEQLLAHPESTAGDFASQYWRLTNKLDDAKLPVEQREAIMKLREAVAKGGDIASGDHSFSDMLGRYQAEQAHVGRAESAKAIRETFQSPEGVNKLGDVFGTPEVKSSVLRKTMANKGEGAYGSTLSDEARTGLGSLEKELGRHELWRGGNSPGATALEEGASPISTLGSGANNPFNRIWALRGVSNFLLGGSKQSTREAADSALQSPAMWKKMMEDYAKSNSPLSKSEYIARYLRRGTMLPGQAMAVDLGGE